MTTTRDKLLEIVHAESGRTLSRDDFDLCMRIAKRAALLSEAQEGEPVAYWYETAFGWQFCNARRGKPDAKKVISLYTAPPSSDQVWNEAIAEFVKICEAEELRIRDFAGPMAVAACGTLANKARSLKRPSQAQEPAKCSQCGSTSAISCNGIGCGYLESGNGEPAASGAVDQKAHWALRQIAALDPNTGSIGTTVMMAKEALSQQPAQVTDGLPPLHYLKERLADHVCRRVDNAGNTPGLTLFYTKIGAHAEHQLYENEAYALWLNIGKALGERIALSRAQHAAPTNLPTLPDRVIDALWQAAGLTSFHPDGSQQDKFYDFADRVREELQARLPSTQPQGGGK